jgi:hypothetical protein
MPGTRRNPQITRDSRRSAAILTQYWYTVEDYFDTGDDYELRTFHGKCIVDAQGRQFVLLADINGLKKMGFGEIIYFDPPLMF